MRGLNRPVCARALFALLSLFVLAAGIPVEAWSQSPPHVWSKRFGNVQTDWGLAVAADVSGCMLVTGVCTDTVDFGGGPLGDSTTGADGFIAKYNSNGAHLWSHRLSGTGSDIGGRGVASDAADNVIVTGGFQGTLTLGGNSHTSVGFNDIFLAKFDADGNVLWSKAFGNTGWDIGCAVATDGSGNILITGQFVGSVDFGGGPLGSLGGTDIFIAKYDANGNHMWSQRCGAAGSDVGYGIAADEWGNVFVAGSYGLYVLISKYDASGSSQWSHVYGSGSASGWANAVATDGLGNAVITGYCQGPMDFGGGAFVNDGVFVAKLSTNGYHVWSKCYGDNTCQGFGIAADGSGNVVVAGRFGWSFGWKYSFGGDSLITCGERDVFVAKYDASGAHLWSMSYGDDPPKSDGGFQVARGVALDGADNILVAGLFEGTANFGGQSFEAAGGYEYRTEDVFIAKYTQPAISVSDDNLALCPQGDADEMVVHLDFCDDAITGDIPADCITIDDPKGGNVILFGDRPIADGPATAANGYQTTITCRYIGGCSCNGTASFQIHVNDRSAGTAFVTVRSPDIDGNGVVDATDLGIFSASYLKCEGSPGYNPCADFRQSGSPSCVDIVDLSFFALHYNHEAPEPPPSPAAPQPARSDATVLVAAAPLEPGEDTGPRLTIGLDGIHDVKTIEMSLVFDEALHFARWEPNPDLDCASGVIERDDHLWLVAIASEGSMIDGDAVELGRISFVGSSALPGSFSKEYGLLSGHVIGADGTISPLGGRKGEIDDHSSGGAAPVNMLAQNYPNPFNPSTAIRFSVASSGQAHLAIYSAKGELVRTLVDGPIQRGERSVTWDGKDNNGRAVASGTYFCTLRAGDFTDTRKLVLLR